MTDEQPDWDKAVRDQRSSVEVTKSTKGIYSWKIKVYHPDGVENNIGMVEELGKIDKEMRVKFPNE